MIHVVDDDIWPQIREEAARDAEQEPALASFLYTVVLSHRCLEDALSYILASKLGSPTVTALTLRDLIDAGLAADPGIGAAVRADLRAVVTRDPACRGYSVPLLYFKGFHALESYRIAHYCWLSERKSLALFLQSRISEVFAVDIHPGAKIGKGILFDHATSVVIGETAVVGDDFSMLHEVTLGGTGKEGGDRHPKIGRGVMIGAGAKVLGNIVVGEGAKIGAGSVVLEDVPPHCTVAGVPARQIGYPAHALPALEMDQSLEQPEPEPIVTDYRKLAREVLRGTPVTRTQARALLNTTDDELLDLLSGAFLLRRARFGRGVLLHVIRNAKSGLCTENCAYCSQSAVAATDIPQYRLQSVDELLAGAREAHRLGAVRYCVVTAGRDLPLKDIAHICEATRRIKAELPLSICVSLGALSDERAKMLKDAGIDRYNHNLETSPRHFPVICQTHTFDDRAATVKRAKAAGMELCSGALLGMGETLDDRVELAFALAELGVNAIPVNFLDPRAGTPLENTVRMGPGDALRALAMFRFVNPTVELRIAGGRERVLGPLQALALYPANSLFTTGYLTTAGQGYEADIAMLDAMGFHVAGLAE